MGPTHPPGYYELNFFRADEPAETWDWQLTCIKCTGDFSQYKVSVSFTFPVKWAAEIKGCSSVWNWQYGKEWAWGSADWYSAVGEVWRLSVFGLNCLQIQVFDYPNCEVGGNNLQQELIIICMAAWNDNRGDLMFSSVLGKQRNISSTFHCW